MPTFDRFDVVSMPFPEIVSCCSILPITDFAHDCCWMAFASSNVNVWLTNPVGSFPASFGPFRTTIRSEPKLAICPTI